MYKFALCDDETSFVISFTSQLADACNKNSVEYELFVYTDIPSLIQAVNTGIVFDLVFMDIFVLDKNGMDYAKEMRLNGVKTDIIFVTVSADYALEGYDVKPLHYLLKPISTEKLETALARFLEIHTSRKLTLSMPGGVMTVTVSDILYIEIYGHEISIYTQTGTVIPYVGTLKEMESMLSPYSFIRSHRSYLLNLAHVTGIDSRKVQLSNGQILPVSRPRYKYFQSQFIEYVNSH